MALPNPPTLQIEMHSIYAIFHKYQGINRHFIKLEHQLKTYFTIQIEFSAQFSLSVVSDSLRPRGLQHARPPCPSPTPGVYSNSGPLNW